MSQINTVLGPISADKLGTTLIHEHIHCSLPGQEGSAPIGFDERKAIAAECALVLEEVKSYGLVSILDATPLDLGRDVELIREVSAISGINIVCSTGYYRDMSELDSVITPETQKNKTVDEMYDLFMKEIVQGIEGTDIKAGAIKVATGNGIIYEYEQKVLRAAARAQRDTGVPVITHTEAGTMGLEQADLLISEGANPKHIMIGHRGANTDLRYHATVIDKGVNISFDRFGIEVEVTDAIREAIIIGLIGIGYADRIMISHDYIVHQPGSTLDTRKALKSTGFMWSCDHIFENVIPALKKAGITDDTVDTMMVKNPRRLLAGK
jgi:phosphotriesterase-related protein